MNEYRTRDLTSKQDSFSKALLEDVLYLEYLNFLASSPSLILGKCSFFTPPPVNLEGMADSILGTALMIKSWQQHN